MNAVLKLNNVEIRQRLAKEGFNLCKCIELNNAIWIKFTPDSYYEIHGVNSILEGEISYGIDVESFIEFCRENKKRKE